MSAILSIVLPFVMYFIFYLIVKAGIKSGAKEAFQEIKNAGGFNIGEPLAQNGTAKQNQPQ